MILLLLTSAAFIEAAVIPSSTHPRGRRLNEMCRRRCRLLFDFEACGATFCNSDSDCEYLVMRNGNIELDFLLHADLSVELVSCNSADEYMMAHQATMPVYPIVPIEQNAVQDYFYDEEIETDDDEGLDRFQIEEFNSEISSLVTGLLTKLKQGCVFVSILSFPAPPLVCTRRRELNSDIQSMRSLVYSLTSSNSAHFDRTALAWIPEFEEWQQAMGLMVAVVLNKPNLPTNNLEFVKSMVDIFHKFLNFAYIQYFDVEPGLLDDLARNGKLTFAGTTSNQIPSYITAANLFKDEIAMPHTETKGRVMGFLASFATNARTSLRTDKSVCRTIATDVFDFFAPLSNGLTLVEKSLLSEFAAKCAQYVEFDQTVVSRSINRLHSVFFVEYPVTDLAVSDVSFLANGLAGIRKLTKLDLVNDVSPALTSAGTPAVGNGPRIEWIGRMVREVFATEDLFQFSDGRHMFFKPKDTRYMTAGKTNYLEKLHQIGRLIGMGLRDHITLEISFTPAAVALLSGLYVAGISHSKVNKFWAAEDPENRSNVLKLKTELPQGILFDDDETLVTADNLDLYIGEVRDSKLFYSIMEPMKFIRNGIYDVLPYGTLDTYSVAALSELLRGIVVIDVEELISKFSFDPPAFGESTDVAALLQTLRNYTQADLRRFLQFVAGSPLPPATGIPAPWLKIEPATMLNTNSLPMSKTCFQTLQLPHYDDAEILAARLDYAILHTTTMELE